MSLKYLLYLSVQPRPIWTQQLVYTVARCVNLKGYLYSGAPCSHMSVQWVPFRILLVPECFPLVQVLVHTTPKKAI